MSTRHFGPYTVELEREDKVLFPEAGLTKADLVGYYLEVAEVMLPHLEGRPLTLHRLPDGIQEEGFYQKEVPEYFPSWIERASVPLSKGGRQSQCVASNKATLAYLANQAVVTPHPWLSRSDDLRAPNRMIFDLDPAGSDFHPVREAARILGPLLESLGLRPFFMTTGSKGGHVWVPLRRGSGFDEVRDFAGEIVECIADAHPDRFTTRMRKKEREGRLYLDVGRNAFGQTAVAPYAVRARPGAPVATPLEWEELDDSDLDSRSYSLTTLPGRLREKSDPWKGIGRHAGSLEKARTRWRETRNGVCDG